MRRLGNSRQQPYDDIHPSTHSSIPYNQVPDAYISGYAFSSHDFAHSNFSTPAVTLQSQTDNYTISSTISAPVQTAPFGSHDLYADHYTPHPLRASTFSDRTSSIGLTLPIPGSITIPSSSAYVLSSPTSPVTTYSTDVLATSSFPYEAWPPYVADESKYESPINTGLPLHSLPDILKPVLAKDYHEDGRYIDQEITATYVNTYQRSQVSSPGVPGATKKNEKLRKRRHRLALTEDGQAVDNKFADAESTQSPLSTIMDFPAAASPGLTTSRRSSLLWVQENVAGILMNPKGEDKGRKEDNRSNKKRKQHKDKKATSERGMSRRDSYAGQTRVAGTYDGDEDMAMDYTTTLDDKMRRNLPASGYDLDCDGPSTRHTASPQQEIARVKHNKVEQKYRNRLNAHFEALLDVLPPSAALSTTEQGFTADNTDYQYQPLLRRDTDMVEPGGTAEKERRVSKSEVLDRARWYIQTLENEHKRLAAEKKQLRKIWDEYGNANREGQ